MGIIANKDEAHLALCLRQAGHRVTAPRRAVWHALSSSAEHLSPAEVLERARDAEPAIGLSTVYRTLRLFADVGLVRPLFLGESGQRFTRIDDGHHDHLVCDGCGTVVELDVCPLAEAETRLAGEAGFHIRGHVAEFFGLCGACLDA